jgi:hypothetical protein
VAWRWAVASTIGTSHKRSGGRSQDAYAVSAFGEDHVFAIVSDGAGSARFGGYGAWLVCRELKVRFRQWLAVNAVLPDDEVLTGWIDDLRDSISAIAERRGTASRQFAATLAALLISPREVVALHIGDSAIVGRCSSEWEVICWPDTGEYASTTYFVTDESKPCLNLVRRSREHDAFAVFSDGVGDLALSQLEELAHPGFFEPMLKPVDASKDAGRLPELSRKLRAFLSGASVCERTDDDKTLILLSGA